LFRPFFPPLAYICIMAMEQLVATAEPPVPQETAISLLEKYKDAAWCITCRSCKLSGRSHKSKSANKGHQLRKITEEELSGHLARSRFARGSRENQPQQPMSAQPQTDQVSGQELRDYVFEFGKYKKQPVRTLDEVLQTDKGRTYVEWSILAKVPGQYPRYAEALQARGLITAEPASIPIGVDAAVYSQEIAAVRTQAPLADTGGSQASLGVIGDGDVAAPMELPALPPPGHVALRAAKRRRKNPFRILVQPHSCLQCGDTEHNISTCPKANLEMNQRLAVSEAYRVVASNC
jgi:hypothetical protein